MVYTPDIINKKFMKIRHLPWFTDVFGALEKDYTLLKGTSSMSNTSYTLESHVQLCMSMRHILLPVLLTM